MSDKKIYQELLKDPRWQIKRLEIMKRDNFTCLICKNTDESLNIHHERYGKLPWEVDEKYLKTLCETCHKVIELCKKKGIIYRNINRIIRGNNFYVYIINTRLDTHNKSGLFAYVIHNMNEKRQFVAVPFCFSKEFIEYILDTF